MNLFFSPPGAWRVFLRLFFCLREGPSRCPSVCFSVCVPPYLGFWVQRYNVSLKLPNLRVPFCNIYIFLVFHSCRTEKWFWVLEWWCQLCQMSVFIFPIHPPSFRRIIIYINIFIYIIILLLLTISHHIFAYEIHKLTSDITDTMHKKRCQLCQLSVFSFSICISTDFESESKKTWTVPFRGTMLPYLCNRDVV